MRNPTKPVRVGFQKADSRASHVKLRSVAISPRLAGNHGDFLRRFELPQPLQSLAENGALCVELRLIAGVLGMTSPAAAEVGALRLGADWGVGKPPLQAEPKKRAL